MELKAPILKILDKIYEPLTFIQLRFKSYDLAFKTDQEGVPILLFLGKIQKKWKYKRRTLCKDFKEK